MEIPYSKDMHKKMAKAQDMLAKGQKVYMSRLKKGKGKPGSGKEGQEGTPGLSKKGQSNFTSPGPLDFIPPPDAVRMKDQFDVPVQ